ncbi:MAG: SAM-dependent methyltransferase [Candidatus Marinimicrobia bacterium CG08_land_8_20_14_0_20_45_22]|nr:MAG: SAM-dependent methyltransferase [Candidatus Marinimicrobia bacterium CG08_land_8_20_14_0_20_45_22]
MPKTEPFDKHSDRYDGWFEKNRDKYHAELEAIRQMMPTFEGKGLEVGVGSGKFAVPFGIKIGVEPSERMAIKAEKQGIRVFRGVAEDLPFSDSEFDFALMVTTICFVDDILKSFREVYRVLRPLGSIIVGFVDKESELGKKYSSNRNRSVFYKEATFFSTEEVCKYLADAGFGDFTFKQTLIHGEAKEVVQDGFDKGAFIVVKAVK